MTSDVSRRPNNVIPFPAQPMDDGDEIAMEFSLDPSQPMEPAPAEQAEDVQPFDDNVAEGMGEERLTGISSDLVLAIEEDIQSRSEWSKTYTESLKYLGLSEEKREEPWPGACGVTIPIMLEGIVRFQSRALVKLFGVNGPADIVVRERVQKTPQIQVAVNRAKASLNERILLDMEEVAQESDRLLFNLANIGFAAKKVYFDDSLGRTTTQFVDANSLILPYGCTNLATCNRFTHEVRRSQLEIKQLQESGFYLKEPAVEGSQENLNEVDAEKAQMVGQEPSATLRDGARLYECYVDLHIEDDRHGDKDGKLSPYVVTIDKESLRILAIRRNWREKDPSRRKRVYFVPYSYVPGEGSYAFGMVHLVGQLVNAATKILRQLVDSGSLGNIPAGFISRELRTISQDPLAPGEWRKTDVDAETLAKAFRELPVKEPSAVLFQLLQAIVEKSQEFLQTADLDISASSQNAPVGTTLALLERQTEIQNAVQTRLCMSFRRELSLIVDNIREYEQDVYQQLFGEIDQLTQGNWYVVPTADPSSATTSQKVIQLQAIGQMAVQFPQVYDIGALQRSIVTAMGFTDAEMLVPDKTQIPPQSLAEENQGFLSGKGAKVYPQQDHDAHIAGHTALLTDPMYVQTYSQSPMGQQIASQIMSHIADHYGWQYRNQIQQQLGMQLPPVGEQQPPDVDNALSQLVAQAAERVKQMHVGQAQQQKAQQQAADPAFQLEQQELAIKRQDMLNKHSAKQRDQDLAERAQAEKTGTEVLRIVTGAHQQLTSQQNKLATDLAGQDLDAHKAAADLGSRLLDHHEFGVDQQNQQDMHQADLNQQADLAAQQAQQPQSNQ